MTCNSYNLDDEEDIKEYSQTCEQCGSSFTPSNRRKYCSDLCARAAMLNNNTNKYREKHPLKSKTCIICGIPFESNNPAKLYCSSFCLKEARRQQIELSQSQWNMLREYILERDNYTCQDCNLFGMDTGMHVHHIKPVCTGGSNNEDNLITLCTYCHARRHAILGKYSN